MTTGGIRVILALDGSVEREEIQAVLPGEAGVQVAAVVNGTGPAPGHSPAADVYVVACGEYSDRALGMIQQASEDDPERPVLLFYAGTPNGFLRRAFEAGADDVVVLPETPDRVLFTLQKAITRGRGGGAGGGPALGKMICMLGPKGGTGKTLTSVNLAVALAEAGRRPIIVDLDLQFGDVGLALGLSADRTMYDLIESGGALDEEKLGTYLTEHRSGVRALLAPTRPDQAAAVTVDFLREVWRMLRSMSDVLIVDSPPDFTPEVIAAVDACTDICMVGMLDALSLKNTKLGLETVERMGYDPSEITLLLNRADSDVGISHADVEAVMGKVPDVLVPSDRDLPRSINEGEPIVLSRPGSEAAAAFRSLAARYLPDQDGTGLHAVAGSGHWKQSLPWRRKR